MRSVFISYRQENAEHNAAVLKFAECLRVKNLPVELDQLYRQDHRGGPDEGWAKWSRDRAENAECVLVIASPGWFDAYQGGGSNTEGRGAGEEARLLIDSIYKEKGLCRRMRFVLLKTSGAVAMPHALDQWHIFDASKEVDFEDIVAWARQKLSIPTDTDAPQRVVYLAECLDDSYGLREGLAEELATEGWRVLPARPYPDSTYEQDAIKDLRRSLAFVQLLQPMRWNGADRDRVQYKQAIQVGLPTFRFRDLDLKCEKIADASQREFLTQDPKIMVRSFDQFKKELFAKLNELWELSQVPPEPPKPAVPGQPASLKALAKLVRVIDRTKNPDPIWAQAFQWLDRERDLMSDRVQKYDRKKNPLTNKHSVKPCHGFLFLCDASALNDPACSPNGPLEECLDIQLAMGDNDRCPAVGVVYSPPPPDAEAWPKLLSFRPIKLHKILVGAHESAIADFFEEVRKVAL